MKATHCVKAPLITETFAHGRKRYFIDVRRAENDSFFLLISSSERLDGDQYQRQSVHLWEEDLAMFVEALSMVLRPLAHGQLAPVEMRPVPEVMGMKAMAEEARPRERLHGLGPAALDTAELLAILLCTGAPDISVLDLCRNVLLSVDNDDRKLLTLSANKLVGFSGIGKAKSAVLLAAFELGRRLYGGPGSLSLQKQEGF